MTGTVERFTEAVRALEADGVADELVALYAEDATCGNVLRPDAYRGPDGAQEFWDHYRRQFDHVSSTFDVIVADGDAAALEWTSDVTIQGRSLQYRGVTMLELSDGSIVRSCAYFDPAAIEPPQVEP